jgi:Flp pilus assembly protein protease CpaA
LIRELRAIPERQRVTIAAICLPAALAFLVVALTFVIFAFNVIDAGTVAYLAVPIGIVILSGLCGLVGRWLTSRVYPGVLIAGIAMLALSLVAIVWALLAVAASSVI